MHQPNVGIIRYGYTAYKTSTSASSPKNLSIVFVNEKSQFSIWLYLEYSCGSQPPFKNGASFWKMINLTLKKMVGLPGTVHLVFSPGCKNHLRLTETWPESWPVTLRKNWGDSTKLLVDFWRSLQRWTLGMTFHSKPWRIHGTIVYLLVATWMVDFYGFHVGKYTIYMDSMVNTDWSYDWIQNICPPSNWPGGVAHSML